METNEFNAGGGQTIVVYVSDDTSDEVDPAALYGEIADDAADRFVNGQRLISMAATPLRHANAFLGREGSGYETKISVAVVYAAIAATAVPGTTGTTGTARTGTAATGTASAPAATT